MTMKVEKPSLAMYSGYSGVGTVENAIAVTKANAVSENPTPWRRALARVPAGAAARGRGADIDCAMGDSPG
ncbi:hypothetical protein GCM10010345_91850 [Streptomyces canarius]|uniref:Uncharacterized protein n=1 Tax=Streptomyces canarius TaxID=285453 RepID=A0ABQ3DBQ9_9ACTN|nr:hypothetical protein GCM10010345_91850 [Streptomyces canarius]